MRTFAVVAFAVALVTGQASAKEWKVVRIGTEGAYAPFNFVDSNNQLQGFDVDIGKAICEKAGLTCEFVGPNDWDKIIPALLAGKFDAIIASMAITEERKQVVDFTDRYYQTPASFIAAKSAGFTDMSPEAMRGKVIGAQSSTIHANYLEDNYAPAGVTIKLYTTQDEANLDLANGRLDAVLADKVALLEWLTKVKEGACCTFYGSDIKPPKWFGEGSGIAVRKGDQDLKEILNRGLAGILADGTYKRINERYFPFAVY